MYIGCVYCTLYSFNQTTVIPANITKGESALYSSNWSTLEQLREYESTHCCDFGIGSQLDLILIISLAFMDPDLNSEPEFQTQLRPDQIRIRIQNSGLFCPKAKIRIKKIYSGSDQAKKSGFFL